MFEVRGYWLTGDVGWFEFVRLGMLTGGPRSLERSPAAD
jgi:hypothetical protein